MEDSLAVLTGYALQGLQWLLILGGSFFILTGSVGLLRFPDFFSRLHAAALTDTMGAELILAGLMISAGWSLLTIKLALIGLVLLVSGPTATHALANSAWVSGLWQTIRSREEV